MKQYGGYIYILTNKKNGVLYIGVTNDLIKRVYEHKNLISDGFTKKYLVDSLIYFEQFGNITDAIEREKQLKQWKRIKKIELFQNNNPDWKDLYEDLI